MKKFLPVKLQYAQKDIQRCSLAAKIQPYDLMQHSYGVLSICCDLVRLLELPLLTQDEVELIMRHDIAETLTGDLPWNVKNMTVMISQRWSRIEEEVLSRTSSTFTTIERYSDEEIDKTLSQEKLDLFRIADMLDLLFYCCKEKSLGNSTPMMESIFENAFRVCKRRIDVFCRGNGNYLKVFETYIASSEFKELENYLEGCE